MKSQMTILFLGVILHILIMKVNGEGLNITKMILYICVWEILFKKT